MTCDYSYMWDIMECSNPLDNKGNLKIDVDALGSVSALTRSFLAEVPEICEIGKVADESTSLQGTHMYTADVPSRSPLACRVQQRRMRERCLP